MNSLAKYYATIGIEKELKKSNKKISSMSEKLRLAHDSNSTIRRRAVMRSNLSCECEHRDELEIALNSIED